MNWVDAEARLSKVILECFPDMPDDEAKRLSLTIYDAWRTAANLQSIEGPNRTGAADIKSLQLAAKHLRRCVSKLKPVGWHGSEHLIPLAARLVEREQPGTPNVPITEAATVVANFLEEISAELDAASRQVTPDARPIFSYLGEKRPGGRPTETIAEFTKRECASIFEEVSGRKPTVSTDPNSYGNQAYGPFLDFVTKVFSELGIEASPETWARDVTSLPVKAINFQEVRVYSLSIAYAKFLQRSKPRLMGACSCRSSIMAMRMLRRPAVETTTGLSRSTIYAMMAEGTFPKPVRLGKRAVGWPEDVIQAWLSSPASSERGRLHHDD